MQLLVAGSAGTHAVLSAKLSQHTTVLMHHRKDIITQVKCLNGSLKFTVSLLQILYEDVAVESAAALQPRHEMLLSLLLQQSGDTSCGRTELCSQRKINSSPLRVCAASGRMNRKSDTRL